MPSVTLDDLNPAQREAVLAPDGPILIIAGAGSGKTRVLTYRIAYQLSEHQLDPERTVAVTFTNKAAGEMRERIIRLLGGAERMPGISTFHSLCARTLRREIGALGYTSNFTIFDEGDSIAALRRAMESGAEGGMVTIEQARSRIEQAKNEALSDEEFARQAESELESQLAEVYRLYQAQLRASNAVDFADLLLLTHRLFSSNPDALKRAQSRAAHLLVDEYQDTNRVQYLLLKALSSASGNICVVGDEDQSIYRWRGADIRNVLDFEHDFPDARIFKLEQNYRSTKTILGAADRVIQNNRERKPKRLWTENETGEPVVYFTGLTERDEADFIAREIGRLTGAGDVAPGDFVVFYRTNAQSRVLEEALVRRRVPYCVVGGIRFYERKEVKDLLAYLRALANPADEISLERAIGVPPRGIGEKTIEALRATARANGGTLFEAMASAPANSEIALRISKQVSALHSWLGHVAARVTTMTVREVLEEVVNGAGFVRYLEGLPDGAERRENLKELLSAATAFDAENGAQGLADFLERVALVSDSDEIDEAGGRVTLMTLHTSKGLEYPVVFIAGMEEGLFPHSRSQDSGAEIEEERRLCYVGMTRARKLLYLTNTLSREIYGLRQEARPSRFVAEIDSALMRRIAPAVTSRAATANLKLPWKEPYVDYTESQVLPEDEMLNGLGIGSRVIHPTFGEGVVRRIEGRGEAAKAWIQFGAGLKLLVLKFAHLKSIAD